MYRLLIVDDEEIITNGLYDVFRGLEKPELDVYKAYSGDEAVKWLERTRIDILLTDIKMPGKNGLQLVDIVLEKWPGCRVIFMTGYDDFDNIYRAVQHPGVTYLLKREGFDRLIAAVENAVREIEKNIRIENLVSAANERMDLASGIFREDYLLHLVRGDASVCVSSEQFEQIGLRLDADSPLLLSVGRVDALPVGLSYIEKVRQLCSIRVIMDNHLSTPIRKVILADDNYDFLVFVQPEGRHPEPNEDQEVFRRILTFMKGTLEVVQSACMESLGIPVTFSLAGEPCGWESVSKKYETLKQLLNFRIGTGEEMLLIDTEYRKGISSTFSLVPADDNAEGELVTHRKKAEALETLLDSGREESFFSVLDGILSAMKKLNVFQNSLAIEVYSKISLVLLSYVNRWELVERISSDIDLAKLYRIEKHATWVEAAEFLRGTSRYLFRLQRDDRSKRADDAVGHLKTYIRKHLNEDLSLVRLAEEVYFNPAYLSRLFKSVSGTNLSDYITGVRIQKAKELLCEGRLKVYEIAESVGYDSAHSFSRFFKKITGVSPQEYQSTELAGKWKQNGV